MATSEELKKYLEQGHTPDAIENWLKEQKIGFFRRRAMMNTATASFNKDIKKSKLSVTKETRKQQHTFVEDITLDLNNLEEPTQSYRPQTKKGFWDFKAKKQAKLEAKYPEKTVLVRIELKNGFYKNFIVVEQNGGFSYQEKFYIFDNLNKSYDIDAQMWFYEFHEDYSIPIKTKLQTDDGKKIIKIVPINLPLDKKIPMIKIREALQEAGLTEIEYASSPSIMYWFTHSRVAEKILMGVDEDAFFRFMKLMIIIILLVVVINFMVNLFNTGMFNQMFGGG